VVQRYQVFLEREQLSNVIEWNKVDDKNQSQYVNVHQNAQYVAGGRNSLEHEKSRAPRTSQTAWYMVST
jgi:hypothetical protein